MRVVLDIESNGLLNEKSEELNATKIHCICYQDIDNFTGKGSIIDYDGMRAFLAYPDLTIIGHNIIKYDIPLLEKLLSIKINARLVDTLGLSWYLYPNRPTHGLEDWGEDLGVSKPKVVDWNNEPIEVYVNRCSEDVKINTKLWNLQLEYLKEIYNRDGVPDMYNISRLIDYISFKLDCAREQEEVKIKLDLPIVKSNLATLLEEKERKFEILTNVMPYHYTYKVKSRPKVLYKKDGGVSSHGEKWFALLKSLNLPEYHNNAIKVIDKKEKGNPNSHAQLKEWLFSLGWQPDEFDYKREIKGDYSSPVKAIPQIGSKERQGELCYSVTDLIEVMPEIEELDSYFVLNHRIGILKGFLEKVDANDFIKAEISGLTNTLRFKHAKPVVNLPSEGKKYWEMIRGCFIAPSTNHILCGSDMSSLEDSTKQHYMYFFDPNYVQEMRTPGFDPHLDIGVLAKMITLEQAEEHKLYDKTKGEEGKSYKPVRTKAKKVNFSGIYGAGPAKIALAASISLQEASKLHTTYWQRNKAVKQVSRATKHKTVNGQMWLYNPVSKFWYSLRAEKDKFSTLNQGTGVYCFDTWVKYVRQYKIRMAMQYHDEVMFPLLKVNQEKARIVLKEAIDKVNAELKLNVPLGISIDFGNNYSLIH
jgi:hypothetical protein